jgi:CheY-like chemotaxis protein
MLGVALSAKGLMPYLAATGHEAVEQFLRHRDEVRAVLLDVNMPGLDGPGALAQIRDADPAVPCCFMTGNPEPYDAEDLLALGPVCVFAKPFRLDEVLQVVGELCERHR